VHTAATTAIAADWRGTISTIEAWLAEALPAGALPVAPAVISALRGLGQLARFAAPLFIAKALAELADPMVIAVIFALICALGYSITRLAPISRLACALSRRGSADAVA
jgi:hypothetical protein